MKTSMVFVAIVGVVFATAVIGYELMGRAFIKGFEQGYVEGVASVTQTEQQVFLQCTAWWFNGSESSAKTAINEYCDRR